MACFPIGTFTSKEAAVGYIITISLIRYNSKPYKPVFIGKYLQLEECEGKRRYVTTNHRCVTSQKSEDICKITFNKGNFVTTKRKLKPNHQWGGRGVCLFLLLCIRIHFILEIYMIRYTPGVRGSQSRYSCLGFEPPWGIMTIF